MGSGDVRLPTTCSEFLPVSWADACANIMDVLDEREFPQSIAYSLSKLLPFDECKQIIYSGARHPVLVYDSQPGHGRGVGMENYLKNSYAINPFYRMYRSGAAAAGAFRLRDIAHFGGADVDLARYRVSPVASEEIGYLTDGLPAGNEELCIGLEMPDRACAMIALARKRSSAGFSSDEFDRIAVVVPFLASAFRRHWRMRGESYFAPGAEEAPVPQDFHLLSPREREIVQLLLKGHSTLSISLRLAISTTTVKTHRKNLYSKLGIATLCELFSLHAESTAKRLDS